MKISNNFKDTAFDFIFGSRVFVSLKVIYDLQGNLSVQLVVFGVVEQSLISVHLKSILSFFSGGFLDVFGGSKKFF